MRILVTGAAGFIGSHLAERLLEDGHEVVGLDSFDPFYPRALKERNLKGIVCHRAFTMVERDIRLEETFVDASLIPGARSFDAIVHLAARAGVRPSIADPAGYQLTNVAGTQFLLEFARRNSIQHFIFASSSSVYGVNPRVPWREDDSVLLPISPYASTKVSGELLGHVYSHLYGIRFIALRFFTVYGPRQRPDLAIHKFARKILNGESIPVYGDGTTRRDYTYVKDIVSGVLGALAIRDSFYEVINLGNNRTVSLAELISSLEFALGRKAIIDRQPEQPGDVPQTWADITKAGRLLGYNPTTDIRSGLRHFVDWLRTESGHG